MIDELSDLTLAMSRVVIDDGARISFDDLLIAYGLTRADLDAVEDDEDDEGDSKYAWMSGSR